MNGSILIVDDERSICIAIERLLTRRGYEVETAQTGEDVLHLWGQRLECGPLAGELIHRYHLFIPALFIPR